MKKKKTNKKIASALAMLMLSAAMLGTSTYAWFTMNRTVTVTGMEVQTKVSGNLLICQDNVEEHYSTAGITQSRAALLEPTSTINGADGSFYYTIDALGNGDARTDAYTPYNESTAVTGIDKLGSDGYSSSGAGKASVDASFNTGTGSYQIGTYNPAADTAYKNAYGYVDYVFFLKATGDATNQNIKMTKCNMLYNGNNQLSSTPSDKAWRVAVFCSETSVGSIGASNATDTNLKNILTLSGAANHTTGTSSAYKAVDSGTTLDDVTYNTWSDTTNSAIGAVGASGATGTKYFKVTVRLWLEGEDTTCTSSTYAQLTNSWTLDLEFQLDNAATAVTSITSTPTP